MSGSSRVTYIDGIRGWAAFSVLLYHVFWETLGKLFPEVHSSWTAPLFNGPLAVYVFFVLSGDALSTQFLQTGDRRVLQKGVLYRYFRLTIPILLSCLISYGLMKMGAVHPKEAGALVNRMEWLGSFIDFQPDLVGMLKYATFDVYAHHTLANSYNPFLWTMGVELVGSLLVFSYLSVLEYIRRPILVSLLIFAFLWANKSVYAPFFVGVSLSLARRNHYLEAGKGWGKQMLSWALIAYYFLVHMRSEKVTESTIHGVREAALLTLALYLNPWFRSAMQSRLSQKLGDLSFPLYLVHFAVIVSFYSSGLLALDHAKQLTLLNALALGVGACVLALLGAYLFMRVERACQDALRKRILPT